MAQLLDQVLQAVEVLQSPMAQVQQKKDATLFLEQVKKGDVHSVFNVGGTLITQANLPAQVKVVGYTLLTELVRNRWSELTDVEKAQLSTVSYQYATAVCADGREGKPLKGKAAVLLSVIIRQQGAEAYTSVMPGLLQQALTGAPQAELACMVLHYISEDLTFFDVKEVGQGDNKRLFLAALTTSVPEVFPFLCDTLQRHFVAAYQAQQEGKADVVAANSAVIHAALGALSTWVEWTPMARIAGSNVLDACSFFLTAPDFRLPALDVLKQIVGRKRTTESWSEYSGLMDKVAAQLVAKAGDMGLMVGPPWWLPSGLSQDLDWGGDLEEVGRRVCGLVVGLAETHMRCLGSDDRRNQILQLLLVFTQHPYLQLPATTLPVWAQLVREAGPGAAASTGNNAALHGLAQSALAEIRGASGPPLTMTPEICQVLLQVLWPLLTKVVAGEPQHSGVASGAAAGAAAPMAPAARVSDTAVTAGLLSPSSSSRDMSALGGAGPVNLPGYFDTAQEWREFCLTTRGQIKTVLRSLALVAPTQVLALVKEVLATTLTSAATTLANHSQPTQQTQPPPAIPASVVAPLALGLDCAIHVVEACIPALLEVCPSQPAVLEELCALMTGVTAVRFTVPRMAVLHARCLEAFGRLLVVRPDLAVQLVTTALEAMLAIPLSTPPQAPPPARITREWKQIAEARLALANSVTQFAKMAPPAFAPHLRALADQVVAMWDRGQLAEGERVLLWEGLLAAAAGVSSSVAGQLVGWLLTPVAAVWSDPAWQSKLSSPQAFQQAFLPVETAPGVVNGVTQELVVGARAERWALYHQLTLLERAMRRTAPQPPRGPSASQQQQTQQTSGNGMEAPAAAPPQPQVFTPPSDYPMNPHLKWCLPVLAAIMQCVHGMAAADAAGVLGPLQGLTAVDDLDKATRLVGEDPGAGGGGRESKEPRCVAGGSLLDARYLLRGLREACSMAVSLAAMHGSVESLWAEEGLARQLTNAVSSNLQFLDHNHMRILIRHVVTQFCARCPVQYQTVWLLPLLTAFLPHMSQRLSSAWQATSNAAVSGGNAAAQQAAGQLSGSQQGAKEGRSQQEVEEMVGDTMLREVTRDHMALLVTLTQRPGTATTPTTSTPQLLSGAQATRRSGPGSPQSEAVAAAAAAAMERSRSAGMDPASGGGGPPPRMSHHGTGPLVGVVGSVDEAEIGMRETPFAMLMTQRPELAQVMISTAMSGLCWPDTETAQKAGNTCRFLVSYGLKEGGALADVVVGPLLQAAIVSLTQPITVGIQGELLALLRQLIVSSLAAPALAPKLRTTLLNLLKVSPEVLSTFEQQLVAKQSDKDQRAAIRQLVAQAGGEEVRKILDVVTRGSTPLTAVTEPKAARPRPDAVQRDQDALLQGAIYNAIFTG